MSRETVMEKAARLLVAGRVLVERVDAETVSALVVGDTDVHKVGWEAESGWACSCPARGRCSHLAALELVTGGRSS